MDRGTLQFYGRLVGIVLTLIAALVLSLWFCWNNFLVLFGLPALNFTQALGASVIPLILFGAIFLLKESRNED